MPNLIAWRNYCESQMLRTHHPYWRRQWATAILELEGL